MSADNVPGSVLLRRWCDQCRRPVWRWHRHQVVRPFAIGRIYAPDERPGPYPNGDCDASQLAALGSQLAAARRPAPTAQTPSGSAQ